MPGMKLSPGEIREIRRIANRWVDAEPGESDELLRELGSHAIDLLEHIEATEPDANRVVRVSGVGKVYVRQLKASRNTYGQVTLVVFDYKANALPMTITEAETAADILREQQYTGVTIMFAEGGRKEANG